MTEGKKQKQYYTKPDYAYFNIFSDSSDWIIRGTTGHGITSQRGKVSQTPCLNCYQVNDEFFDALEKLSSGGNKKYEVGVIFDKQELRKIFREDNVKDVNAWTHELPRPTPNECWYYDIPKKKMALWPFSYCDVVRIRIKPSALYGMTITAIPSSALMGLLVKEDGYRHGTMSRLMRKKKWEEIDEFEVFPLL
jgi:hypothetical protein